MENKGTWWYSINDNKVGPVSIDELKRQLSQDKINARTLAWTEGQDIWRPIAEIPTLAEVVQAIPPPLPHKLSIDPLSLPMATRWPRFFARLFDMWWESLIVAFSFAWVLYRTSPSFVEWISRPGSDTLFGILCLPLVLVLDAIIYTSSGNTPGKALLGLKVGSLRGGKLSFAAYISRNLRLWINGLACGIPFINLFTMGRQSGRISRGLCASYDEVSGDRVRAQPISWLRKTVFVLLFFGLLVVIVISKVESEKVDQQAFEAAVAPAYQWTNPLTQSPVTIDGRWTFTTPNNGQGQTVYMFQEASNHAVVLLGNESGPGIGIQEYVGAFVKANLSNMAFIDGGAYSNEAGTATWTLSGHMVSDSTLALQVKIYQKNDVFWRIVSIQGLPYDYSKNMVEEMRLKLRSTF